MILVILVSISSAENALSNDVKNITLLARKVLKIRRSAIFLGTPGICPQNTSFPEKMGTRM